MNISQQSHATVNSNAEVYTKTFKVRYSDVDLHAVLKTVKILDYFQDIASEHAAKMGVSGYDVLTKNLAWVIFRYQLKINKLPAWNETIEIQTFRSPYKKLYEIRAFTGLDGNGNTLFHGKTAWILVDLEKRKPARLDKHLPELLTGHEITIPNDFEELNDLTQVDDQRVFNVGMMDLDFNKHVNNSVYALWAIEAVPEDILFSTGISEIDIKFIAEALYKDQIISQIQTIESGSSPCFLHRIIREKDQTELARLKTVW